MRRDVNNKTSQPASEPQGGAFTWRLAKASEKPVEETAIGSGIPKNRAESPSDSRSGEANSANRLAQELLTSFERHFGATMSANMGDGIPVYRTEDQSNSQLSFLGRETLVKKDGICRDLDDTIRRFEITHQKTTGRAFSRPQSDFPLKRQNVETKTPEKFVGDQPRETDGIPEQTRGSEDTPIAEFLRFYKEYKHQKAIGERKDSTSDQPRETDGIPEQTRGSEDTPIAEFLRFYKEYKHQKAIGERKDSTSDQPRETDGIPEQTRRSEDTPIAEFLRLYKEYKHQKAIGERKDSTSKAQTGDSQDSGNTSK